MCMYTECMCMSICACASVCMYTHAGMYARRGLADCTALQAYVSFSHHINNTDCKITGGGTHLAALTGADTAVAGLMAMWLTSRYALTGADAAVTTLY